MYCSECGNEACGKFCSHCGTALAEAAGRQDTNFDWRKSCNYERVVRTLEVTKRIEAAKAAASAKISGSQMLGLVDAAAAPLMYGLSSVAIAKVVQPLYGKMGIKTGKQRREFLQLPPGVVLANIAVALAAVEHTMTDVVASDHQCKLKAMLPADLRSMESHLSLTIQRAESTERNQGTWVAAEAMVEGQLFDWGKSQSRLDQLFTQVRMAA